MKKLYFASIFLFTLFAASSCVKDNRDDCPPDEPVPGPGDGSVTVVYRYALDQAASRSYETSDIEHISLFIFDDKGTYVGSKIDESPVYGPEYKMNLDIEPGSYQFIAWFNLKDCYKLSTQSLRPGETGIEQVTLMLNTGEGSVVDNNPHRLFYGSLQKAEVIEGTDHVFEVVFVRDTYDITLRTVGFNAGSDNYRFQIVDRSGVLGFDNARMSAQEVFYQALCEKEGNNIVGELTVLRLLEQHRDAVLTLENTGTGEIVYEANLMELLTLLRQQGVEIDFERIFEYDIVLYFDPALGITVTVNGWKVVEDGGDIHI